MIKEAICTGASVAEALEAAERELNAPETVQVQYEVLAQPKAKTLGLFGGSPAKVRAYYEESPFGKAEAYLKNILNGLGMEDAAVSFEETEEDIHITLECGDDYGSVIGRRGETLDAIQYLTRLVLNRGNDGYKRVSINVGNYREKRESTLRALARNNAAKVRKYGRNVVLDPMNPYERRIIHTTVQEIEGVSSHSVGSDSERKVVITLAEGVKPLKAGGYHNRGSRDNNRAPRGGYNNRGPRDRYRRDDKPSQTPSRPPRSDSAGASLYGKIEVNNSNK